MKEKKRTKNKEIEAKGKDRTGKDRTEKDKTGKEQEKNRKTRKGTRFSQLPKKIQGGLTGQVTIGREALLRVEIFASHRTSI